MQSFFCPFYHPKGENPKSESSLNNIICYNIIMGAWKRFQSASSLQSDIANYWPGLNKTAFLVFFVHPCEQG